MVVLILVYLKSFENRDLKWTQINLNSVVLSSEIETLVYAALPLLC